MKEKIKRSGELIRDPDRLDSGAIPMHVCLVYADEFSIDYYQ